MIVDTTKSFTRNNSFSQFNLTSQHTEVLMSDVLNGSSTITETIIKTSVKEIQPLILRNLTSSFNFSE